MKSFLFLLLLTPWLVHSQLSLHAGLQLGDPGSLYMAPYEHPDPIFGGPMTTAGLELGYRFTPKIELRAFYYAGGPDKGSFLEYGANSRIYLYGIRPQTTIYSWKDGKYNLDLGLAYAKLHERVDWHYETWGLFSSKDSAAGTDEAEFQKINLVPSFRIYFKKPRITVETALCFSYYTLDSVERKIEYDSFYPSSFSESKANHHNDVISFQLRLGYSFW